MIDHAELDDLLRDPSRLAVEDAPARGRARARRPDPTEPIEQESLTARMAKLAGLIVAVAMLSGALVTAALSAESPRHGPGDLRARSLPSASLTGVHALLGVTSIEPGDPEGVASTQPSRWPRLPERQPPDPVRTVRDFYASVRSAPERALTMVSPELIDSGSELLVRSWRTVRDVTLHEVSAEESGMVRVVVTLLRDGGRQVRMTQLLGVSDDATPLISAARLLSAQHFGD